MVTAIDVNSRAVRRWKTKRLFLAAGHFSTARLIARSLNRFDEPIRISDSQYFFFPLFSYIPIREEVRFALAEVFIEILQPAISDEHIHLQIYGMNRIFEHTLRRMLPRPLPVAPLAGRLYLVQGYLPSSDSGHLEMELKRAGEMHDKITVRGIENCRARPMARKIAALLRHQLIGFGVVPPASLSMVAPGRSFHSGGSFPMGGAHPVYSSDTLGRPAGLKRVHIIDAANFPTIASSTIGLTIMANADRIARGCAELPAN
jgi:choline dehydrogenase-like flavoprotein